MDYNIQCRSKYEPTTKHKIYACSTDEIILQNLEEISPFNESDIAVFLLTIFVVKRLA